MFQYRKATTEDIPELVRLRIEFLKEVGKTETYHQGIALELETYFKEHLQAGDYVNWLAVQGHTIISTAGICFYTIPPNFMNHTGNRAYILNVYTLPKYRRKGISKQVFSKLMAEVRERKIEQVSLHATKDGEKLYREFGFTPRNNEMIWGLHI